MSEPPPPTPTLPRQILEKALYVAFLEADQSVKVVQDANEDGDRSGCTAVVAFVTPTHVVLAHAGDSRAVLASADKVLYALHFFFFLLFLLCPLKECCALCRMIRYSPIGLQQNIFVGRLWFARVCPCLPVLVYPEVEENIDFFFLSLLGSVVSRSGRALHVCTMDLLRVL